MTVDDETPDEPVGPYNVDVPAFYTYEPVNRLYALSKEEPVSSYKRVSPGLEPAERDPFEPPVGAIVLDESAILDSVLRESRERADDSSHRWDTFLTFADYTLELAESTNAPAMYVTPGFEQTVYDTLPEDRADDVYETVTDMAAVLPEKDDGAYKPVKDEHAGMFGDALNAQDAEALTPMSESTLLVTTDADYIELAEHYDITPRTPAGAQALLEYQDERRVHEFAGFMAEPAMAVDA